MVSNVNIDDDIFVCDPIFGNDQNRFFSLVGVVGDDRGDFDRYFPFTLNVFELLSMSLIACCGNAGTVCGGSTFIL